jgi:hypothetical protein
MALTLQDANLVWQKVNKALSVQVAGTSGTAANPETQNAFRAMKLQFATQKLNIQLQFVPFATGDVNAATGYVTALGASTLYAIWGKKTGTGTTAAFLGVYDKNSNGTSTDQKSASLYFKSANDEAFAMSPNGWLHTDATGPTIASCTTIAGGTQTASSADTPNGFAIFGA